ncbi:hypothetical protein [Streptomyces sp. NPDC047315]|uniref:hypothetical protein n=1 Tax=Streptomyces sp. NPDC047315 TaxID=3155142 RepID=UPI0033DDC0D3
MSSRTTTRLILTTVAVVVDLALGASYGWPVWGWMLLPTLVAGVLLLTMYWPGDAAAHHADPVPSGPDEPEPPVEAPYFTNLLTGVPVPSAVEDYPFLFSATVWWRTTAECTPVAHGNPASLAVSLLLRRVQNATVAEHPSRSGFLERWLEGTLGAPTTDGSGLVTAFATDVRLTLRPADRERLDELDGLRKSVSVWEGRRRLERDRREYLGEDVLRTPGSAVVWWLARHDDEVERAVEMIGPLACLSAAANDQEVPEAFRHLCVPAGAAVEEEPAGGYGHPEPLDGSEAAGEPRDPVRGERAWAPGERVSALLDDMGLSYGSPARTAFVHRMARMSEREGRPDVAASIRQTLLDDRDDPGDTGDNGDTGAADTADAADAGGPRAQEPSPFGEGPFGPTGHVPRPPEPGRVPQRGAPEQPEDGWWATPGRWTGPDADTPPGPEHPDRTEHPDGADRTERTDRDDASRPDADV